jgi:hypothetical protein
MTAGPRDLARDDDDRPPRRPMCRCIVVPQSLADRIQVEAHPDLIELDARMEREL